MGGIAALILIACFVAGFFVSGRWVENVVAQLLLGAVMGVAIVFALVSTLAGIAFAGCLVVARMNH